MPGVRTIADVPIVSVGEDWKTLTGSFSVTPELLAAALNAFKDPAIQSPKLKLGHFDPALSLPVGDGYPCFGRADNFRLSDNGMELICDYVGVPEWLAAAMPTYYPQRSIEGQYDYTTDAGKTHAFCVTAISLLGDKLPAISTLDDLKLVIEAETIDDVPMMGAEEVQQVAAASTNSFVVATKVEPDMPRNPLKRRKTDNVAASLDADKVRNAFYAEHQNDWWWIRTMQLSPDQLIVEDDADESLYRIPFTINGEAVTFDDAISVKIEYIDTDQVAAGAGDSPVTVVTFASADESRPATSVPANTSEDDVDKELLKLMGLAEDASQDEIKAKIEELNARPAKAQTDGTNDDGTGSGDGDEGGDGSEGTGSDGQGEGTGDGSGGTQPSGGESKFEVPEGTVLVSQSELESLKVAAGRSNEMWEDQRVKRRDAFIAAGMDKGKFRAKDKAVFAEMFDKDEKQAQRVMDAMADDVVPVHERGYASPDVAAGSPEDEYPAWMVQKKVEA